MPSRLAPLTTPLAVVAAVTLGAVVLAGSLRAAGDPAVDLPAAVAHGETLWKKAWASGAKSCVECHAGGPNAMKGSRLASYPKFDKALGKVVTGQQKLNQMIVEKSRGTALELGSTDLNALEAYVRTLK